MLLCHVLLASLHACAGSAQYLIKKRVDIDAGDFFRVTPLHLACIENHYEISRVLLKSRATVGVSDLEGDLPIHWAATKGNSDVSVHCSNMGQCEDGMLVARMRRFTGTSCASCHANTPTAALAVKSAAGY